MTLDLVAQHVSGDTVEKAREVLTVVHACGYREPHVTWTLEGEVLLEWWKTNRHLSLYISSESVEALKVWGPNIVSEMEDVTVVGSMDLVELWKWLDA